VAVQTLVLSHWYTLLGDLQASGLDFYKTVEGNIARRKVPDATQSRIDYKEGGVLSAKREYLRVARGKLVFDICAAPFGTGFFVSWWLGRPIPTLNPLILLGIALASLFVLGNLMNQAGFFLGLIIFLVAVPTLLWFLAYLVREGQMTDDWVFGIPLVGPLYGRFFAPDTYYKTDTALMFQEAVHAAVLEAVDALTTAKGCRALTELERKPILRAMQSR
jgi:hypothetical protein